MNKPFQRVAILCLCIGIAAACTPETTPDSPAPILDTAPTLSAPQWAEAQSPITLETVPQIAALGRLDQPNEVTTVFTYALSPDATVLAGLNNAETLAWDLIDGSLLFTTSRSDAARSFFSSDKTAVFIVSSDGTVRGLSAETGAEMFNFAGHPTYNETITFDAETDRLAMGGSDGTVKIWDVFSRQSLATLNASEDTLTSLAFSVDGLRLAAADIQGNVTVWEWETAAQIDTLRNTSINVNGTVSPMVGLQLRFSPDGERLAIATASESRLWTMGSTSEPVRVSLGEGLSPVLLFSPDGSLLLTGTDTLGMALWDGITGAPIARLIETAGQRINADFSPDGNMLVTTAFDGALALWNLADIRTGSVGRSELSVNSRSIFDVEWTDDGRLILIFDGNGAIYAWGIPPQ